MSIEDIFKSKQIDPSKWFDGPFWGWQACESKCKVCSTCKGLRHFIEFFLRSSIPYPAIIEIVEEVTDGGLILNKPNLSSHRQKHMGDNLISCKFAPEGKVGPLIPRAFLKSVPYEAAAGQITVSKCSLPYCSCSWLEPEGCTYKGNCPAKQIAAQKTDSPFIQDCQCEICASPFRLFIEALGGVEPPAMLGGGE